ncbi:MAG: TetR/AcrR family transcriptional regulator [Candidatus Methanoperedens sp.]|nr:TetR/AcrR family transcriptional regulator [Candidatus Methanoperedens sp.]
MGITERKELEKQKMRKLILKTAMKLFLEEGFENITIRRIAEKIEYSPATIYLYFKDKDEILYTLHNEGFEELYRRQLSTLSIKDPLQRLREQGEVYISFALENPEYYDLMFIMRGPAKKIIEKKERDIGMRSYEFLKENVEECMEAGLLPEANVDVAAFSLWSHVHGIASLIIRDRCTTFSGEQIGYLVKGSLNFMLDGILNKGHNLNCGPKELKVGGNQ